MPGKTSGRKLMVWQRNDPEYSQGGDWHIFAAATRPTTSHCRRPATNRRDVLDGHGVAGYISPGTTEHSFLSSSHWEKLWVHLFGISTNSSSTADRFCVVLDSGFLGLSYSGLLRLRCPGFNSCGCWLVRSRVVRAFRTMLLTTWGGGPIWRRCVLAPA